MFEGGIGVFKPKVECDSRLEDLDDDSGCGCCRDVRSARLPVNLRPTLSKLTSEELQAPARPSFVRQPDVLMPGHQLIEGEDATDAGERPWRLNDSQAGLPAAGLQALSSGNNLPWRLYGADAGRQAAVQGVPVPSPERKICYDQGVRSDFAVNGTVLASQLEDAECRVLRFMADKRIPCAQFAVMAPDGRLVLSRAYTNPDYPTWLPYYEAQTSSLCRIGSITKLFTATAVLQLVNNGVMALDDPIEPFMSFSLPSAAANVTVRELLQHDIVWPSIEDPVNAAVATQPGVANPLVADALIAMELIKTLPISRDDILSAVFDRVDSSGIVRGGGYSAFGYMLLGMLVESVTLRSFESYVEDWILGPLSVAGPQAGHTAFERRVEGELYYYAPSGGPSTWSYTACTENESRTHDCPVTCLSVMDSRVREGGLSVDVLADRHCVCYPYGRRNLTNMVSTGGWIASAAQLLQFGREFTEHGSYLNFSDSLVTAMFNAQPGDYGLGWAHFSRATYGATAYGHTGSLDGANGTLMLIPTKTATGADINSVSDQDVELPAAGQMGFSLLFSSYVNPTDRRQWLPGLIGDIQSATDWGSGDLFPRPGRSFTPPSVGSGLR